MEDFKNVNLTNIKECPDCASVNILYSQAREQVICRECGLIFEPFVADMEKVEKTRSSAFSQKAKKSAAKSKAAVKKPAKSAKKRR